METYWCQYATDWAEIKDRWELTMTRGESQAVLEMLDPWENPRGVEVWTTLGTTMREFKPEPTEGAGEFRVRVVRGSGGRKRAEGAGGPSRAGGREFPKATVPSARDGDGDGVVCEQ